eukprot:6800636-Alexandrium_andersonii.AAC.1
MCAGASRSNRAPLAGHGPSCEPLVPERARAWQLSCCPPGDPPEKASPARAGGAFSGGSGGRQPLR